MNTWLFLYYKNRCGGEHMKVTMKDIAKKLNISINAVSIALNDKPGVSDEMRLLILRTADEMGYINEKRKYLSVFSRSNICILMQSYYADTGHFYSIVLKVCIYCVHSNIHNLDYTALIYPNKYIIYLIYGVHHIDIS